MPTGMKVSHFQLTPPLRLLKLFCEADQNKSISKRLERWMAKRLWFGTCTLLCGRTSTKKTTFRVFTSEKVTPEIWHVTGSLNGNRNVKLRVDLNADESHVIEKY